MGIADFTMDDVSASIVSMAVIVSLLVVLLSS